MLNSEITEMIMASMKARDKVRTTTLQLIKSEIQRIETSGKQYDLTSEVSMLKKMVKQREDSINQYQQAGRNDLVDEEKAQLKIIKEFLPEDISEDVIETAVQIAIKDIEPIKKNMGLIIKSVKQQFPTADGSIISKIVKNYVK